MVPRLRTLRLRLASALGVCVNRFFITHHYSMVILSGKMDGMIGEHGNGSGTLLSNT